MIVCCSCPTTPQSRQLLAQARLWLLLLTPSSRADSPFSAHSLTQHTAQPELKEAKPLPLLPKLSPPCFWVWGQGFGETRSQKCPITFICFWHCHPEAVLPQSFWKLFQLISPSSQLTLYWPLTFNLLVTLAIITEINNPPNLLSCNFPYYSL